MRFLQTSSAAIFCPTAATMHLLKADSSISTGLEIRPATPYQSQDSRESWVKARPHPALLRTGAPDVVDR
jgi:hypothetical protein